MRISWVVLLAGLVAGASGKRHNTQFPGAIGRSGPEEKRLNSVGVGEEAGTLFSRAIKGEGPEEGGLSLVEEGHGVEAGRRRRISRRRRRRCGKSCRIKKRQAEWKKKAKEKKAARFRARTASWKNIARARRVERTHKQNGGKRFRPKVTCNKQEEYNSAKYPEKVMAEQCPNPVLTSTCISRSGYESIRDSVRNQLKSIDPQCSSTKCPRADWAGCVLRMAGHDFMDFDPSTDPPSGGSDGCTDLTDEDNVGLAPCLAHGEHGQALKSTYLKYCGHISLADFLVIAAEAVMYESLSATQKAYMNVNFIKHFKWGRTTARECPGSAYRLPHGTDGCKAVKNVFMDSMGLSKAQATALMGVHTLGRARTENSGHVGRWTTSATNSRIFNNNYYKSLRTKGWRPMKKVCGKESTHQWVRQGPGPMPSGSKTEMMLDTDICLAYNIPKGASGEVCCAWQDQSLGNKWERWEMCGGEWQGARKGIAKIRGPAKRTKTGDCSREGFAASHVKEFAKSESKWLQEFQKAWTIATSNGFSDLKPLNESCSWEPPAAETEPQEGGASAALWSVEVQGGEAAEEEAEEEEGEAGEEDYAGEEEDEAAAEEEEAEEEEGEAGEEEYAEEEEDEAAAEEEEAEEQEDEAIAAAEDEAIAAAEDEAVAEEEEAEEQEDEAIAAAEEEEAEAEAEAEAEEGAAESTTLA